MYMSDQETPIGAMMEAALKIVGKTAKWYGAVPENSAVGESQSNGRAESAVNEIEGHVRTLKGALESRIRRRIPTIHPVMRWLIEHSAITLMFGDVSHVGYICMLWEIQMHGLLGPVDAGRIQVATGYPCM